MTATLTDGEYCALAQFRHLIRRFLHFSETAVHRVGLEPQQHQALLAIRALDPPPGPPISKLATFLLLRHHSAVGLVDRLESRGLVIRTRGIDDRREVRVCLTASGEELLERLSIQHRDELRIAVPALVQALSTLLEPQSPLPTEERL